ncbi:MAG: hypothetical protein DMG49_10050 [Acidobacteria bacterium]|nr:MAG: hypothetical protein DMG49_10050 [Acidobacteriota bacterium]
MAVRQRPTAADSHIDLPVIRADRARLDQLELVPFRVAISMQVDSIMTGHLNVPALEPDPDTPATLSHNILTNLLRNQLGYQGLIVTDAMDMGGITVRYAPGEAAVRAVAAGADCLLMPPVPDAAFEALRAAAKSGSISKERLDASVRRILHAKARLGLNTSRLVDVNAINQKFASAAWQKELSGCRSMEQSHHGRCCWLFTLIPNRIQEKILSANCVRDSTR